MIEPTEEERLAHPCGMGVIHNGVKELRQISHTEVDHRFGLPKRVPVTSLGEKVEWVVGSDVPIIFDVQTPGGYCDEY